MLPRLPPPPLQHTVNVQNEKEEANNTKALNRFEFLEAIIRIGMLKYVQNGDEKSIPRAVDRLCREHLALFSIDSNVFRRDRMYKESIHDVIAERMTAIEAMFNAICGLDRRIDIGEWCKTLELCDVLTLEYTEKQALVDFVLSNPLVIDEHSRSAAQQKRDRPTCLTLCQFLEALCRVANSKFCGGEGAGVSGGSDEAGVGGTAIVDASTSAEADATPAAAGGEGSAGGKAPEETKEEKKEGGSREEGGEGTRKEDEEGADEFGEVEARTTLEDAVETMIDELIDSFSRLSKADVKEIVTLNTMADV